MVRLRTVSSRSTGWTRRRSGKGFRYLDEHGERLGDDDVARIKALAIPPAWRDVWICSVPNGHIQATGIDAADRKQYLYHPEWRLKRDRAKFDRVTSIGRELTLTRAGVLTDLALEGMPMQRAAATAVRLIDLGYFRIGNDAYADANGSFGLTTLRKRHVRRRGDRLVFSFVGKSGVEHQIEIDDPLAVAAVETMRRRRGKAEDELLAYQEGRSWLDLNSAHVNDYLRASTGVEFTAKDFRTWHATVLAAVALAESDEPGDTKASRKRAVRAAMVEVSDYLGNTPTIAKSSYVDPRVLDQYEGGVTIGDVGSRDYDSAEDRQDALEKAVLVLLTDS